MKIVFPYLAQLHQVLHSLPIAAELAQRPGCEVEIAATQPAQLAFARRLVEAHAPQAPLRYRLLPLGPLDSLRLRLGLGAQPWKHYLLAHNLRYFRSFDAVVTPERTSLLLKRMGLGGTRLIWTRHGAGDREIGFADDVKHFDYVLMAGRKIEQRLLDAGLIRPGAYCSGIYAKFDWASLRGTRLFDNDRPTVVYNPHFRPSLSSWPKFGTAIIEAFARSARYNLIFAPHVRLFDPPTAADRALFERWSGHPNLLIDPGSERSIDMSYTGAADLYLGDVSSQVAEFVCEPRPCLFLNAHGVNWRADANYRFWAMGDVLDSVDALEASIDQAFARRPQYHEAQQAYVIETFDLPPGRRSAQRAAEAILAFLRPATGR